MKMNVDGNTLTRKETNRLLREVIRRMSLEEYVAFWNVVGRERLDEIISDGGSSNGKTLGC